MFREGEIFLLHLKLRAQWLGARCRKPALLCAALSVLFAAAGVCSGILWGCAAIFGTQAAFAAVLPAAVFTGFPALDFLLPPLFFVLTVLYYLAHTTAAGAYRTCFYAAATDEKTADLRRLFSIKSGMKHLAYRCRFAILRGKCLLRCFLPFLIGAALLVILLFTVGLPKELFPLSVGTLAVSFAGCAAAFFIMRQSYALTGFLLFWHPKLPVKDAFISSALLTEGKLLRIAGIQLRLLPWKLFSCLLLGLPFTLWYLPAVHTALYEEIYGEKKPVAPPHKTMQHRQPADKARNQSNEPDSAIEKGDNPTLQLRVTLKRKKAHAPAPGRTAANHSAGVSSPTAPRRINRASMAVITPKPERSQAAFFQTDASSRFTASRSAMRASAAVIKPSPSASPRRTMGILRQPAKYTIPEQRRKVAGTAAPLEKQMRAPDAQ